MTWKDYGQCVGRSDVDFFPDPKLGRWASRDARDLCAVCFVRAQCLDHALKYSEVGIWGGTSDLERKYIKARYIRPKSAKALAKGTMVR